MSRVGDCRGAQIEPGPHTGPGDERFGDARGQALSGRDVTRRIGTARVRVAEAERSERPPLVDDRNDERRGRVEAAMELGDAAGPRRVRVGMDVGSQRRAPGAYDVRDGARAIVRADPMRLDQFADGARALARGMRAGDTSDRPAADEMNETEICERRNGESSGSLNGVARGCDGGRGQSCDRKDPVRLSRLCTHVQLEVTHCRYLGACVQAQRTGRWIS